MTSVNKSVEALNTQFMHFGKEYNALKGQFDLVIEASKKIGGMPKVGDNQQTQNLSVEIEQVNARLKEVERYMSDYKKVNKTFLQEITNGQSEVWGEIKSIKESCKCIIKLCIKIF